MQIQKELRRLADTWIVRSLKGIRASWLESDDLFIRHRDGGEGKRYRHQQTDNAAQYAEKIYQERQYQKHREAEIIVLHYRVTGLHGGPEIHPLIDDKQVREFVHGGHNESGNDTQQCAREREESDQQRRHQRGNEEIES